MSQPISTADLEVLETYLDGELDAAEAARVDARLAAEPALSATLGRLRAQRAVRLEAMSTAFDTDAAAVERLVASVRDARAAEVAAGARSRWRISPSRFPSHFAAAACLVCGLVLGAQLARQGGPDRGRVETPGVAGAVESASTSFGGGSHGAYVVTLRGRDGVPRVTGRFHTAEEAQRFVETMRTRARGAAGAGDADIGNGSY